VETLWKAIIKVGFLEERNSEGGGGRGRGELNQIGLHSSTTEP